MSVTGFWVVGVVSDGDVVRLRREFPGADCFGRQEPGPSGDLEWWSEEGALDSFFEPGPYGPVPTEQALRVQEVLAAMGSAEERHEADKEELLQLVPQCEGVGLFCASTRKGDPVAALHYGLGPEAAFRLPGRYGDFLVDAAGVRSALPGVEATLDLTPGRRSGVRERIRDWLGGMTDGAEHDLDDLVDGPLRVLRHAARHGFGAAGMTLWY
ncbi:hypothetical protein ABH940_007285 [Streptacidiphilus sp. BW17]|uniref:hypothetical protein n=1 Tax=Streptacidiphilus sp. BW17 TaxID=3156274 RepID=UPI003510DF0C